MDKHGFVPEKDGSFKIDSFEGKVAVEVDGLLDNIRTNVSGEWYEPLYSMPYDERIFVMVCGGPSLNDHLEELRAKSLQPDKYLVACSNMTAGHLLENGIKPHVHFIIDPQKKKRFDVTPDKTRKDIEYWINVACDPSVFNELKAQGIKPYGFLADFDVDGKAIDAVKKSMAPGQPGMMAIQGGTMAGLRAINLAEARGHRKMEYYGFDATVRVSGGAAQPYAYHKKRGEAIIDVECQTCKTSFSTTLILQKQVNEFVTWRSYMPWVDIEIIGGGLVAHHLGHIKARESLKSHSTHRYTENYKAMQKELHAAGNYGVTGKTYVPSIFHAICQLYKRHGSVSVLDYGAAGGGTMEAVKEHLFLPPDVESRCYDPFVDEFAAEPAPADLLLCTDVLEHVEPECTKAVLDHIAALTRRMAIFAISLQPARKKLSDGRNAHINLPGQEFWLRELKKRFILSEAKVNADGELLMAVGQSIEDVKETFRKENARIK